MPDLFTPDDTAILLIDHQDGTMSWVRSIPLEDLKANALAPPKAAKALYAAGAHLVPRGSGAGFVDGRTPGHRARGLRVPRTPGRCRQRPRRPGSPTLSALQQGFEVQVVGDAGGSMSKAADDIALTRTQTAGAQITSTNTILTELAKNWTSPSGERLIPIVGALNPQPSLPDPHPHLHAQVMTLTFRKELIRDVDPWDRSPIHADRRHSPAARTGRRNLCAAVSAPASCPRRRPHDR